VNISGTRKNAKSSFFPNDWSMQDVVAAINMSFVNKIPDGGNTYHYMYKGIRIEMNIDSGYKIITAYLRRIQQAD
jgi:hypothetical protein